MGILENSDNTFLCDTYKTDRSPFPKRKIRLQMLFVKRNNRSIITKTTKQTNKNNRVNFLSNNKMGLGEIPFDLSM